MKILMVCLGNICRSPMAEGILKEKIKKHELNWEVDSAGTSGWHQGELPDLRGRQIMLQKGIDISDQRSRMFVKDDFAKFDLILTMDQSNYDNVAALANSNGDKDKIKMILEYTDIDNLSVPDPYFDDRFEYVYDLLDQACERIVESHT